MDQQSPVVSRAVTPGVGRQRLQYTIGTLVSDPSQHAAMLSAFRSAGFTPPACEFLHIDNCNGNLGDGYRGLNSLIEQAEGRYVILCHQDIRVLDGKEILDARLAELDRDHPDWAVAGNAGVDDERRRIFRITDRFMVDAHTPGLPLEVASLDENLLILRRDALLGFSDDLSGFHLYGTDLVCQARLRGRRAFVIDFHVEHLGHGSKGESFAASRAAMVAKYRRALQSRTVLTPSTTMVLGPGMPLQRARLDLPEYLRASSAFPYLKAAKRWLETLRERFHGDSYVLDGETVVVPGDTPFIARKALRRGIYEATERRLVRSHVGGDLPVIELGAAYGVVSQSLRKQLNPDTLLVLVEANPALLDICRANIQRVADVATTHVVNAALGYDSDGQARFVVTSGVHTSHVAVADEELATAITVPAVTLGELLRRYDIRGPYVLVSDIEGAEWDLVVNDAEALAMCDTLVCELHPDVLMDRGFSVDAFLERLRATGLEIAVTDGNVFVAKRIAAP